MSNNIEILLTARDQAADRLDRFVAERWPARFSPGRHRDAGVIKPLGSSPPHAGPGRPPTRRV